MEVHSLLKTAGPRLGAADQSGPLELLEQYACFSNMTLAGRAQTAIALQVRRGGVNPEERFGV